MGLDYDSILEFIKDGSFCSTVGHKLEQDTSYQGDIAVKCGVCGKHWMG